MLQYGKRVLLNGPHDNALLLARDEFAHRLRFLIAITA